MEVSSEHAFAAIMGTDAIEMFKRDLTTGKLTHLSSNQAPRPNVKDAYRNVKVHTNGKILYGLTEDSECSESRGLEGNSPFTEQLIV